jgi:hypothetical protein
MVLEPDGDAQFFNCVGNEEILYIVIQESNTLRTINRRKYEVIGHIALTNCIVIHIIA